MTAHTFRIPRSTAPGRTAERLYDRIARAIAYIDKNRVQQPELDDIARHAGMSKHHLQRTFADWAGVSPKKFLKSLTLTEAKTRLRQSESVLDTAFDIGLSGPGRLHDLFVTVDAVTPGEYKSRGNGMTFRYGFHPSPFGNCLIAANERGLTGVSFVTDTRDATLSEQRKGWENGTWTADAAATAPYAERAFGDAGGDLRVLLRGSPFRVKVWEGLLKIPEGAVISYGDLAARLDRPDAARAVAGAIAGNLIGYVVPCHRVIRESGAIGGYRWGDVRKSAILGRESSLLSATALESGDAIA